jgi:CheY-like chemotaxis protein
VPDENNRKRNKRVRSPVRVLVAEDERLLALTLTDLLEAEGYDVHLALTGTAALVAGRRLGSTLDLLVTDLNMPGMTGEALIRAMRTMWPSLPVIVVTGSAPPGGAEELQRQGGGHGLLTLLHKPVSTAELLAALLQAASAPESRLHRGSALRRRAG